MTEQLLISQFTSAAIVVYVLQWLKKSRWFPWITAEKTTLNRWLAAAGAFLAAVGVHFAFDATQGASGTYVITITGLTAVNVLHGAWHFLNQFALQQAMYDAVTSKTTTTTVTIPSSLPGGH